MSDSKVRPVRSIPRIEDFPFRATDSIRLGDLDPQSHVNNAVYATYFETGRVYLIRDVFRSDTHSAKNIAVVRLEIDYLRELHWPGPVDIGTRVARVGNTSLTLDQAVFKSGDCVAAGRSIIVQLDAVSRKPSPIPEEVIARLRMTA
ncbi:MAG: acyl-CoA thioesterase [Variibacter sp.]